MENINIENQDGILSPKSDTLFKKMFFEEKDTHDTLAKLLQDCIGFDNKQLTEISLLDRTIEGENKDDKSIILDVNVKLSDGTLVDVEIQRSRKASFNERSIFYTSKRLVSQGYKGVGYEKLKQTVALNIVDFDAFNDTKEFYSTFYLMEQNRHTILSDIFRIDYLELKKLNNMVIDKNNKKELWVRFFNAETKEELNMIKEADPTFEKVVDKLVFWSADPSVLTDYEKEERARRDEEARMIYVREQAAEEGIKNVAFGMLDEKLPNELICRVLKIDQEKLDIIISLYEQEVNR